MPEHAPTIPEGLDLVQARDGVIIRRTWFSWTVIPLIFFAVLWDGFLVFWYTMALKHGQHGAPLMMLLFPLLHVAVGLGLTYFIVCSFVNKTDVIINFSGVEVSIYPMPWPGKKRVAASEITDVMVRQRVSNNSDNVNYNNRRVSYAVMYAGASRKEQKLISFSQSDQADYVANAIRMALQLKDT